ncbi:MAG: cytochrome C [Proteobacteria bacterium]|nr:cytochrome C [Pseudomonadota bacterium]
MTGGRTARAGLATVVFTVGLSMVLLLAGSTWAAPVSDGMAILKSRCFTCHAIKGPAATTLKSFSARKGPDLFYAGVKYNEEWLIKWLARPEPIRPAGFRYFKNTVVTDGADDAVDWDALKAHVALTEAEAESVAAALMTFRTYEEKIKKNALTEAPADAFMGEMNFDKFSGCLACHEIEPGYGGVTGPEVYTTGERLQPDFVYSYLKDPQSFDPKSFMPNKELGENFLQVLTKYMLSLEAPEPEDEEEGDD